MKTPKTLRTSSCLSLYIPPKYHCNLAVVEDMDERLPVFLAQVAGVSGLLAPSVYVCIGGESAERGIQCKLERLWR